MDTGLTTHSTPFSKHFLENSVMKVVEKCKGLPERELEDGQV